ncbi:MAG: ABC transporter permease [Saprospiraceae bacterium]|nr:ABC transporter permease [Saprospiraceae bacterium]
MIKNYFKIAWRNLMKNKVFSFINVFGLAAGLASCMLICLYVYDELRFDKHHKNVEQLYQLGTVFVRSDGEKKSSTVPAGVAAAMKQEFPEVVNTTRFTTLFADDKVLLQYKNGSETRSFYESKGCVADASFFTFFDYNFIEGTATTALVNPNSVVITEAIAQKIFGKTSALNKIIHVESNTNGTSDYTVTGVFRPGAEPTHIDSEFFLSFLGGGLENYTKQQTSMAGNNMFFTYVELQKGTNVEHLKAKFPAFVDKYMGNDLKKAGFNKRQLMTAVSDIHLNSEIPENVTPPGSWTYLYILMSIALFTLLIACINFMNLSTARSSKRSGEVGIRKVLGAQRQGLIYQFMSESLLLSGIAFIFSIAIVRLLIPVFESVSGKIFSFTPPQYLGLISIFLGLSIVAGLLAGIYPAFYLSSFIPIKVLKGRFSNSLAAVSLRKGLVVFQFTISVMLIVASVVIANQMDFLRSKDLGFAKDQQLVIPLRSETSKGIYTPLKNALSVSNQIQSVGASAYYPGIFNPEDANYYREGQTADDSKPARTNRIDDNFLQTMDIKPVAGRLFGKAFTADSSSIIINEKAVSALGFASPEEAVGKKISTDRQTQKVSWTVVGVVKDFHFEDLKTPIMPFAFMLSERPDYNYLLAHVKGQDITTALKTAETAWHQLNPNEPFEYSFLNDDFQKNYKAENRLSSIVGYFTFIAILISCLGLFGLATFSAEQRTKEIGVRKVLGASVSTIVALLSKDFLKLVLVAVVIASPIAWFVMNKWLQDFAYRININWTVFAITTFVALMIAFLTIGFQAIKAAVANPVKSLRTE